MKFFSKLFGGSKKQEAAHKTTSDEQFIEIFMSRSQLWDLSFTPEVIQMGLNQCKAQAAEDDKIYKLPELYGSMVIYKAEQGDQQSLEFLNRALEHGATAEDFAQWWNSEDLMRRMLEWELNMRKHKLFVEIQGADATIDDELAIIKVRKLLPEFGEPTQYFGEGKLDKFLPVELQFRVDQIIRELGAEKRLEIAAQESSFNAYLYKRLMPETHYAEVDYLKEVANQAFDAFEQGEIQKAGELAKEFKILAVKEWGARDTNLVMNLRLFANIFAANGDYLEAQYCLEEFIEVFGEAHEHYLETLTSLGQVYLELGNVAEAIQTQQKAYDLQKHQPDPTGLLPRILNNYALALSTHEKYEEAIPFYQEALKGIEEKYGKNNELYALYLSNLCAAFCQNNQYDEALSPCLESMNIRKELLGEEHPDFAESLENLAVIDVVLGEYDEALRLIQKVHDIRKRILGEQHPDYALSLMHLGITYQHVGNLAEAYDCLKQAVDVRLKQLKVIIPSLAERAKDAFLESIKFDFNLFIAFSVSHLSTFPESTFHLTNMRLATKGILLETSQDLSKRVYNTNNDFLISAYESWVKDREELAELYEATNPDKAAIKKIKELDVRVKQKEKKFQKAAAKANLYHLGEVDWTEIQARLKTNEAAVEVMRTYQTSSGKLVGAIQYAFLIITPTTDQPICVVVENGAELENEFAERYQLSIKTTYTSKRAMLEDDEDDFNTSDASNGELYDAFWGALAAEIGDYEKVYFSPDGVYNQINVQTLFNADTGKFLIEEWEVHVLGSLKDILHSEEEEDMVKSKLAYLIGGPDYLAGAPKDYKGIPKIAYLPGAKQEVQEIEYLLKTNQWTVFAHYDAEATEEQVNEDLSAIKIPQLLHFSTHGFFQEEDTLLKKRPMIKPPHPTQAVNPLLRSGLLLAGAETSRIQQSAKQRDGILTAYEVLNLSLLGTELVTLSACETGLGVNKNGEGVYGLQRAFQIAGASNVLMSMWKVPDKETKELMVHFYEYWLEMGDKRKAFRRAQQEMKDKYPEPFYWGAFVMIGR